MDVTLTIGYPEFTQTEIQSTLTYALNNEADYAKLQRDYFATMCKQFESQYQLASDEFMHEFEAGNLGDDTYTFDWYAAKRGLDLWSRRFSILSKISL